MPTAANFIQPPSQTSGDRNNTIQWHGRLNLDSVAMFRYAVIGGQSLMVLASWFISGWHVFYFPVVLILAFEGVENVVLLLPARTRSFMQAPAAVGILLLSDIALLTIILLFSGDAMNPSTIFYLVELVAIAVLWGGIWTWFTAGMCMCCYGLLFFLPGMATGNAPPIIGSGAMRLHLIGMFVCFVIAAICIASLITLLQRDQHRLNCELAETRDKTRRMEAFTSLMALAAGAAHDLATPLSTIAIAVGEMSYEMQQLALPAQLAADVELIQSQIDRCRSILDQMSPTGHDQRPIENIELRELIHTLIENLPSEFAQRVLTFIGEDGEYQLPVPRLLQGLTAMVQNAIEASPPECVVEIHTRRSEQNLIFSIIDSGAGVPSGVVDRVGEPFFSTKPTGRGMGLFLARQLAFQYGGRLTLTNRPGGGALAELEFPLTQIMLPRDAQ